MLAAYLFSLIVGGGLVTFSLLGGGKDKDASGDPVDHGGADGHEHATDKASHLGGHDAALAVSGTRAMARRHRRRASILKSTRFWTFFSAFGGLTGTAVSLLHLAGEPVTGLLALGLGLAAGTGAGVAQQVIGKDGEGVSSMPKLGDYRGQEATVLLPVAAGDPGKIRIIVGGTTVDLRAVTEEKQPFAARAPAFVLDVTPDGTARIIHPPDRAAPT